MVLDFKIKTKVFFGVFPNKCLLLYNWKVLYHHLYYYYDFILHQNWTTKRCWWWWCDSPLLTMWDDGEVNLKFEIIQKEYSQKKWRCNLGSYCMWERERERKFDSVADVHSGEWKPIRFTRNIGREFIYYFFFGWSYIMGWIMMRQMKER